MNTNEYLYGKLKREDLEKAAKKIFSIKPIPERKIVFYTGFLGKWKFEWYTYIGTSFLSEIHSVKVKDYYYISLFKKHGSIKLKVYENKTEIYKGTKLIKTFYNIDTIYFVSQSNKSWQQRKKEIENINKYLLTVWKN